MDEFGVGFMGVGDGVFEVMRCLEIVGVDEGDLFVVCGGDGGVVCGGEVLVDGVVLEIDGLGNGLGEGVDDFFGVIV